MKYVFEGIGMLVALFIVFFSLYIQMVKEPECEKKGFAGVDSRGCWIIKDGVRAYENN